MELDFLVDFLPLIDDEMLTEGNDFTEVMDGGDFIVFKRMEILTIFDFDLMFDDGSKEG